MTIPQPVFDKILADTSAVLRWLDERGIPTRNGHGEGDGPVLTPDLISFNGDRNCGHDQRNLGVTWPDHGEESHEGPTFFEILTGAVQEGGGSVEGKPTDPDVERKWFAGALLPFRQCDGDCSHETYFLPRVEEKQKWQKYTYAADGTPLLFGFTKTAFKPYDLAVTAALIILKHHCPNARVSSDGESCDWEDARMVCEEVLGYGKDFVLPND